MKDSDVGDNTVEVFCIGGLVSEKCTKSIEVQLSETSAVIDLVDSVWAKEPFKPILFVTPALSGFSRLLEELSELGRNPFLVEATGIPETMLSGLSLDSIIEYWIGMLVTTLAERKNARRRSPRVSRREVLRRLFLVPHRYVLLPRLRSTPVVCGSEAVCPFSALEAGRLDESRCQGCMLCAWECPESVEAPLWTGPSGLLYTYRFIDDYGLDGILFICRSRLEQLDKLAVEASPARLAPFHVPCVSWLSPRLLKVLTDFGVYVHVYAGSGVCRGCGLEVASTSAASMLVKNSIRVSGNLAEAGIAAFTGYARPRRSLKEVVVKMVEALRGTKLV
ncbi:MAG TPA: hypothetical protein EYH50_03140 [Pyrodictium delaneyi]|uniref:4Fe-4S ferredoxin-type domain-containing protein n=1 Tax=Pyrodictium delaneyi TaxID=1273541 RepID=A0A832ZT79_9CREN|nr:hypothetical protein [Pyrodictium delaneyi]